MDTIEVIQSIRNQDRAAAVEKINDMLYNRASEAMKSYKEIVAQSFFGHENEETEEEETEE